MQRRWISRAGPWIGFRSEGLPDLIHAANGRIFPGIGPTRPTGCQENTIVDRQTLMARVKQVVHTIEPDAKVMLYGSRANQTAGPESDWDFLVLVEGDCDDQRKDMIRHKLYEVEWDTGEVLCSIICSRQDWESSRYQTSPFIRRVAEEGIPL